MLISTECFSPLPLWNFAFSTLTLLVGQREGHPARKKTECMVICLEWVADLHVAQLMPLPLTVSCFSKIQIGFTFLVPTYPGSPRKRSVKWVCIVRVYLVYPMHGDSAPGGHLTSVQTRQLAMSPPVGRLTWFTCYWHCPHSMWTKVCVMVRDPSICLSHVGVNLA